MILVKTTSKKFLWIVLIADILEIYVRKEQNDTMISSFWSALLSGPIKLETSVKDNFL